MNKPTDYNWYHDKSRHDAPDSIVPSDRCSNAIGAVYFIATVVCLAFMFSPN